MTHIRIIQTVYLGSKRQGNYFLKISGKGINTSIIPGHWRLLTAATAKTKYTYHKIKRHIWESYQAPFLINKLKSIWLISEWKVLCPVRKCDLEWVRAGISAGIIKSSESAPALYNLHVFLPCLTQPSLVGHWKTCTIRFSGKY